MTKKKINNGLDIADKNFEKLSIQVSLNGLSFCVADAVSQRILYSDKKVFSEELNPITVLKELKELVQKQDLANKAFDEVVVIHRNTLFALVPKPLFQVNELSNYLKFNTKVLPTDTLEYDEIKNQDMVNVYVPYTNINNYIYDLFGEFSFFHNGSILVQSLLNSYSKNKEDVCYVNVGKGQMDIMVSSGKNLKLYNSFLYETKEDFAYYLLFVLEQLELDTETVPVKLFGSISEDDELFQLCYTYVQNIAIFAPNATHHLELGEPGDESIDFTILNSL
ncbi:DUF3822 family protein [Maribacter sp. MJ134]|uniref:DUF3822 family protein n=1 Tax=unclassified Maribacter TaxID=2615042 RepID=UPI000C15E20D|nr:MULTISPECIES: DUF3822 family protein [unclassified Maribacter]AZQ57712.1 DUF3822 family protein [Maribacter sp. MJ134]PIB27125.1 hypothetical protein BFP77_13920 [Maribacter sp. 4U21]